LIQLELTKWMENEAKAKTCSQCIFFGKYWSPAGYYYHICCSGLQVPPFPRKNPTDPACTYFRPREASHE